MTLKVVINPKYQVYEKFVSSLPVDFTSLGSVIYHGRNEVRTVLVDGIPLIVKMFQEPDILKQLQYLVARTGKAKKAYEFAKAFQQNGLNTPEAVGYVLVKNGWKVINSFFVSTICPGQSLMELIDPYNPDEELLKALADEIAKGHEKGLMHGDLNLSNVYCQRNGKNIKIYFIDINRSTLSDRPLTMEQCAKNMMRLIHHEILLWQICELYAARRGWNAERFARFTISKLRKFQRKKIFLGRLKGKKVDFSHYQKVNC